MLPQTMTATLPPVHLPWDPRHGLRLGGGLGEIVPKLRSSLVEAERRVAVGHQPRVREHPEHPAIEADGEVEEPRRVTPREEERKPRDDHEQEDEASSGEEPALVSAAVPTAAAHE